MTGTLNNPAIPIAVLLVALAPASANAEISSRTQENLQLIDSCPETATSVSEKQRSDAIEHYNRGAIFYEQGDYDSAVDEFVAAYCDSPHPQMFFNIGQSFERLLDFETAVAFFERFISDSAPGAANLKRARVRVRVLKRLPARIRVASVPPGAQVRVRRQKGLAASGKANDDEAILAPGGNYTLEVEAPGYERITQPVELAIGQPYSYYFKLERKKGVLRVATEPKSARIFIDDRLVGLGSYSETIDIGRYEIRVEAAKREPVTRKVVVNSGQTTDETFRLAAPEATGRWELVVGGGLLGSFAGGSAVGLVDLDPLTSTLLVGGGLGLGVAAGIIAVPRDLPISRSSFIITSALIGGLELGLASSFFLCDTDAVEETSNCNGDAIFGAAVGGMLGGVVFGAVTAPRFDLDPGDAAILNSGMLWGTAVGSLFFASFDSNPDLAAPLILAGLNLGIVTGVAFGARVDTTRRRIALIDLGGVGGAIVGFAAAAALDAEGERVAHSALLGVGTGLIGATLLTRFIDEPDGGLDLSPTTGAARDAAGKSTMTVGASLTF